MAAHPGALSFQGLLSRSFSIFRQNFTVFVGMNLLALMGIVLAGVLAITLVPMPPKLPPGSPPIDLREQWAHVPPLYKAGVTALVLVGVLVAHWAQAATVVAASERHLGRPVGLFKAFAQVPRRGLRIFWLLSFSALAPPLGVILAALGGPAIPAAVLENRGIFDAWKRGASLSEARYGRVIGIFLILVVLELVAFQWVRVGWDVLSRLLAGLEPVWLRGSVRFVGLALPIYLCAQWWMTALTVHHHNQQLQPGISHVPQSLG